MTVGITVRSLDELLAASSATPSFKEAVTELVSGQIPDRIDTQAGSPPVKVLRLVMKLLEEAPDLAIDSIRIDAESSCSGYTGHVIVQPGDHRIDFDWNCAWRAIEEGWTDAFGDPDQIRAARTLGYQCFRRFDRR